MQCSRLELVGSPGAHMLLRSVLEPFGNRQGSDTFTLVTANQQNRVSFKLKNLKNIKSKELS